MTRPDDQGSLCEPPTRVRAMFERAGWAPGRRVAVSDEVPRGHPAHAILASFSGLSVGECGPGEECARSDMVFRDLLEDASTVRTWETVLKTRLVSVASVHRGHGEMYVASDGQCYGASRNDGAFYFEGASFSEAVERRVFGRRSPMLSRSIKLMPDYQCFPLWWTDGEVGNVDPRTLPLTPALIDDLTAWAATFDRTLNQEYPPESGFATQADADAFEAESQRLVAALRERLGAQYQVAYQGTDRPTWGQRR
ncbi:MAG: SUKH-3 domain-containing protein [Planctomycetes bacterium]|nr:SUKH-3 domain-containing protein [Planctomycetota bacterium]